MTSPFHFRRNSLFHRKATMKTLLLCLCSLSLFWAVGCSSTGGAGGERASALSGEQFHDDIFSLTPKKLSDLKRFDRTKASTTAANTNAPAVVTPPAPAKTVRAKKPKTKNPKAPKKAAPKQTKTVAASPVPDETKLLFVPTFDSFPPEPANPFDGDFWPIAIEVQSQFVAGGEVISSPKVVTMPGQRAIIEMMRERTLPDGSTVPVGISFAVDPAIPEGLTPDSPTSAFSPLPPLTVQFHAKAIEEVGMAERKVNGESIEHPYFSKHALTKTVSLVPQQVTQVGTIRSEKPGNLPVVINLLAKWHVAGGE